MRPLFRAIAFAGLASLPAAAQTANQQPSQPTAAQQTSAQDATRTTTSTTGTTTTGGVAGQEQTGQWTSSTNRTPQDLRQRTAEQGERIRQELQRDLQQAGLSEEDARRQSTELAAQVQQLQQTYTRQLDEFQRVYARALAAGDMSQEQAEQEAHQLVEAIAGMHGSHSGGHAQGREHGDDWNAGQSTGAGGSTLERTRRTERDAQGDETVRSVDVQGSQSGSTYGQQLGRAEITEISNVLREAGVETEQIRKLAEQDFEQESVRAAVEQAHEGRGDASEEARRVARQVEELKWNAAQAASTEGTAREASSTTGARTTDGVASTRTGDRTSTAGGTVRADGTTTTGVQTTAQTDAETVLRQAGVGSSRVRELKEQGYPEQEVERSVERAQIELGRGNEEARQEARAVAQRVRMMGSGVDPRTDSFTGEASIRGQLERADVDSQKIQDLEARGFPAADTRRAVMEAYERRAEEVAAAIERMKSANGGR